MAKATQYPRIIVNHDWISLNLGNSRRLTASRSGEKASGSIPDAVFAAWCDHLDQFRRLRAEQRPATDKPFLSWIEQFGQKLPQIWPEWNAPPRTYRVGERVRLPGSPRRPARLAVVVEAKRDRLTLRVDGEQGLVGCAADLVEPA